MIHNEDLWDETSKQSAKSSENWQTGVCWGHICEYYMLILYDITSGMGNQTWLAGKVNYKWRIFHHINGGFFIMFDHRVPMCGPRISKMADLERP